MSFGEMVRNRRKEKGLTQKELAEMVGIDFTYLSKIETGDLPPPSDEIIKKLATNLDLEADELFLLARKVPPSYRREIIKDGSTKEVLRLVTHHPEFRKDLAEFVEDWRKKRRNSRKLKQERNSDAKLAP